VLVVPARLWQRAVAHCLDGLPFEACGLLAGLDLLDAKPPSVSRGACPVQVPWPNQPPCGQDVAPGGPVAGNIAGGAGGLCPPDLLVRAEVCEVYPASNAARSARLYTVEPRDLLAADRAAERAGWSLIGVWHSHTHTPAYPSPTDIEQAPDPAWHYVVVSLADSEPVVRSYRIVAGSAYEEPVVRAPA
jgi:proteasome lid subunit RPN8/RPN11